jgi:two-component system response regulator ResD
VIDELRDKSGCLDSLGGWIFDVTNELAYSVNQRGNMNNRILVVDDERIITEVVERYLQLDGYDVKVAEDGAQALEIARNWHPDLVILDLMLPEIDGLEVCRRLRQDRLVPIIMLTAKGEETDRIVGLELGADDYIVKPFSPRELVARVKSVLRRTTDGISRKTDDLLRYDDLVIDPVAREVTSQGHCINLTAKEFDLLSLLASHPNQVFTREQLMNQIWDYTYSAEYGTITVHIRRLRAKIEADPLNPRFIKTLWGVGYKFEGVRHETKR